MLIEKIQQDLILAMKQKNQDLIETLRYLMAQIKNKQIEEKKDLNDEQIIQVIRKQLKELEDAIILFQKGDRKDLIEKNNAQIKIISQYLPQEISDIELKKEIEKIVVDNKELYNKNPKALIGIAIKTLKEKASPQRIMKLLNSSSK